MPPTLAPQVLLNATVSALCPADLAAQQAVTLSNPVLANLQQEAALMAVMRHPNIVVRALHAVLCCAVLCCCPWRSCATHSSWWWAVCMLWLLRCAVLIVVMEVMGHPSMVVVGARRRYEGLNLLRAPLQA